MRIGIDIGRVIIEGGSQSDRDTDFVQATDVEAIKATKAIPGAIEAIKSFVDDGHEVFRPASGIVDTRTWDDVVKEMDQWIG